MVLIPNSPLGLTNIPKSKRIIQMSLKHIEIRNQNMAIAIYIVRWLLRMLAVMSTAVTVCSHHCINKLIRYKVESDTCNENLLHKLYVPAE
jgi:hypothetical protein